MPEEFILASQNAPESIRLLAAQRQLYTEAKWINKILFILAFLSAIAIPLALALWPGIEKSWGLLGLVIFFFIQLLKSREGEKRQTASVIQEELDTKLFQIPWNRSLANRPISPEVIVAADKRFKGNREKLKDWYYLPQNDLPHNLAVLFCQRTNFVWEYRQRQSYIQLLGSLFFTFLIGAIILGLFQKALLLTFLLGYLSPILPFLGVIAQDWLSHWKTSEELHSKEKDITAILQSETAIQSNISMETLRLYQDAVFKNRQSGPMVPDWFYNFIGKRVSDEVNQASQMIIGNLQHIDTK
jgi:hypothetical protein